MTDKVIHVTQPSLAPLDEYVAYLRSIWETGVLTHNGPMVQRLERELKEYLGVEHVACVANGTCALQLAIRALNLSGEIITTPFTFIATASIISWERCRPVFVDIDADTWNIDAGLIEEAITDKTSAILPVHVFSAPCDVVRIASIATRYGLKVIYDAAHALGVQVRGSSVLRYGDVSAVSLHATKLLNTAEGGVCVTRDRALADRIKRLRFFGYDDNKDIVDDGMNAKMSEVHAALGLANLSRLGQFRSSRRDKYELYRGLLAGVSHVRLQRISPEEYNFSYMPVVFDDEDILLRVLKRLKENGIHPRRYFYPSLNTVRVFQPQSYLPVSESVARTVLCLPLYDRLSSEDIERICQCVASASERAGV